MLAEQLSASLAEADRECVSVGESFHELSAARITIERLHCPEPERDLIRKSCQQMGESLHSAVVALQYHDRLAQRLELVRRGLLHLQTLLHHETPDTCDEWLHALRIAEQMNRTEQKRLGPSVGLQSNEPPVDSRDSIELF